MFGLALLKKGRLQNDQLFKALLANAARAPHQQEFFLFAYTKRYFFARQNEIKSAPHLRFAQ